MKTTLITFFTFLTLIVSVDIHAQQWIQLGKGLYGPGGDGSVAEQLYSFNGKVYACGFFQYAGDNTAWSVAYWDGTSWQAHGEGILNEGINDLVMYQSQLLAFNMSGSKQPVYVWNGSSWQPFASGGLQNQTCIDAEVYNQDLFVLCERSLFRYSGSTWDTIPGSYLLDMSTQGASIVVFKDELYIGGKQGLYKYSGTNIQPVWTASDVWIRRLRVFEDTLYIAGGTIGHVGSDTITGVATFDGTNLKGLENPLEPQFTDQSWDDHFNDVAKIGNIVVAGGEVYYSTNHSNVNILMYDGVKWSTAGLLPDERVKSLLTVGNTVYVAGWFFNASGIAFSNVAALRFPENKIKGTVFLDMDNNCQFDTSDVRLKQQVVKALPGPYYALTNSNGDYTMYIDPGNYTVTSTSLSYADLKCPISGVKEVTLLALGDSVANIDFGFVPEKYCAAVRPYLISDRNSPCRRSTLIITITNEGFIPATDVKVDLMLSPHLTFIDANKEYQKLGEHSYHFSIDTILMQETHTIRIEDSVICDLSLLGSYAVSTVVVSASEADCSTGGGGGGDEGGGRDSIAIPIRGPSDPNEKLTASHTFENAAYVMQDTINADDILIYQINFQNVGNDTAYRVVIHDTISKHLDLSTFKIVSASHPYTAELHGSNMITWTFDDIKLPDSTENNVGSNGSVRYRIGQVSGNMQGTTITNNAAIIFDFNPAIITNTTKSIIPPPTSVRHSSDESGMLLTPNPSRLETILTVANHSGQSANITIYDVIGKVTYSQRSLLPAVLNLRSLSSGAYFVNVRLSDDSVYQGTLFVE